MSSNIPKSGGTVQFGTSWQPTQETSSNVPAHVTASAAASNTAAGAAPEQAYEFQMSYADVNDRPFMTKFREKARRDPLVPGGKYC
jgi:hypothetical protein